jgi:hypothetical protein
MGMGYVACFADVVKQDFVKEVCLTFPPKTVPVAIGVPA